MAASRNSPSADLPERVGRFFAARLHAEDRLCVGLSGGCDSVVLLHIVRQLGIGNSLSAIHVHHGLSANADAWADFCVDYCQSLSIPLSVRRVTVELKGGGLEQAARAARYEAFLETGANCLLLAQHRGDQAETVLYNLLRGTGLTGLAGMLPERTLGDLRLLRPLLDVPRAVVEEYARSHGLRWIDDESNLDTRLSRNFLRHQILPPIVQRFDGAEAALARSAGHCAEAVVLLDELAEQDWVTIGGDVGGRMVELRKLSPARLKNLLRHRLRQLGWRTPDAVRLDEFCRQLLTAGPDRHPELVLPDGRIRAAQGRLNWVAQK